MGYTIMLNGKNILYIALILPGLLFAEENRVKITSFGPMTKSGVFAWNLMGKSQSPIARIELKSRILQASIKPDVKEDGSFVHFLEERPDQEFYWVYSPGNTSFDLRLNIEFEDGSTESQELSLSFGEKSKTLLAAQTPMFRNPVPDEPRKLPYLARNGKSWKIMKCSFMNAATFICEYVPQSDSIYEPGQLYRYMLTRARPGIDLTKIPDRMKASLENQDCQEIKMSVLESDESGILFEWSHAGCSNPQVRPTHEISRMIIKDFGVKTFGFAQYDRQITAEERQRIIDIIESED